MSDRDYYEILGLTPQADGPMVDQAYWHLARKCQSLMEFDASAGRMLDDLNEAYGVLGTPRLREQYDAFRDDVLLRTGMIKPMAAKRKERPRKGDDDAAAPRGTSSGLPLPHIKHGRTYLIAAIIAALAFAGMWQGVNVVFVLGALAAGLALSLLPTLRRQWAETIHITFPTLPSVSAPETKTAAAKIPDVKPPDLKDTEAKLPEVRTTRASPSEALAHATGRSEPKSSGRKSQRTAEQPPPAKFNQVHVVKLRDEFGLGADADETLDADLLRESTSQMIARWRKSVGLRSNDDHMPLPGSRQFGAEEAPIDMRPEPPTASAGDDGDSEAVVPVIEALRGKGRRKLR